jgi:5-deoxy-glucuronate isomerase
MAVHLTQFRGGFGPGTTEVTRLTDGDAFGIGLAVVRLGAGERVSLTAAHETAWLLVDGDIEVRLGPRVAHMRRRSLFDGAPSSVHVSAGTEIEIEARSGVELTRFSAASTRRFDARIYGERDVRVEHRGKGAVGDAAHRIVRTVFDRENADPAAELVLGEVITLPGRWSSWPPHHHAQPEIYHYRFTHPQGYGHAELGDEVVKVRAFDTLKIVPGRDHAQVAGPGYGMYYSWVIRHLPGDPYLAPTFDDAHRWTKEPGAKAWSPEEEEP